MADWIFYLKDIGRRRGYTGLAARLLLKTFSGTSAHQMRQEAALKDDCDEWLERIGDVEDARHGRGAMEIHLDDWGELGDGCHMRKVHRMSGSK